MNRKQLELKLKEFTLHLQLEEYAENTIRGYDRDIHGLLDFLSGNHLLLEKLSLISYKHHLEETLKPSSVNRHIVALNQFLRYIGRESMALKTLKIQESNCCDEELTNNEFQRLVTTAVQLGKHRMAMILITLASTGIRIGELPFITVSAVQSGTALIKNKGKVRVIILPNNLQRLLLKYIGNSGIQNEIFISRTGNPLSRSYIASEFKRIAEAADVDANKVYPHNFPHFFARKFLDSNQPLTDLADHLGHNSIETTRRYLKTSVGTKQKQLAKLLVYPREDFKSLYKSTS